MAQARGFGRNSGSEFLEPGFGLRDRPLDHIAGFGHVMHESDRLPDCQVGDVVVARRHRMPDLSEFRLPHAPELLRRTATDSNDSIHYF